MEFPDSVDSKLVILIEKILQLQCIKSCGCEKVKKNKHYESENKNFFIKLNIFILSAIKSAKNFIINFGILKKIKISKGIMILRIAR